MLKRFAVGHAFDCSCFQLYSFQYRSLEKSTQAAKFPDLGMIDLQNFISVFLLETQN